MIYTEDIRACIIIGIIVPSIANRGIFLNLASNGARMRAGEAIALLQSIDNTLLSIVLSKLLWKIAPTLKAVAPNKLGTTTYPCQGNYLTSLFTFRNLKTSRLKKKVSIL